MGHWLEFEFVPGQLGFYYSLAIIPLASDRCIISSVLSVLPAERKHETRCRQARHWPRCRISRIDTTENWQRTREMHFGKMREHIKGWRVLRVATGLFDKTRTANNGTRKGCRSGSTRFKFSVKASSGDWSWVLPWWRAWRFLSWVDKWLDKNFWVSLLKKLVRTKFQSRVIDAGSGESWTDRFLSLIVVDRNLGSLIWSTRF